MNYKNISTLSACIVLFSLLGCNNRNQSILSDYFGEYKLIYNEGACTLTINEDKTYQIKYQNNTYGGEYYVYEVINEQGFKPRVCYIAGEYYPDDAQGRAFGISLRNGDGFTGLPYPLERFFANNCEDNQYLYIHTFIDVQVYTKYGSTAKEVTVDENKQYKEMVYYPNRMTCSEPLSEEAKELDPNLMFYQEI